MTIQLTITEAEAQALYTLLTSNAGLWSRWRWTTPADLQPLSLTLQNLMSAVSEFATKQNAFNDQIDTAINGLVGDVSGLKDLIAQLQSTQGTITPEDQALLDQIQARTEQIASRLTDLDNQTPPAVPAELLKK